MTRVINWAHEATSLLVIRIIRHEDKFITSNLQAAHLGGVGGQVWWFSSNNMFVFFLIVEFKKISKGEAQLRQGTEFSLFPGWKKSGFK